MKITRTPVPKRKLTRLNDLKLNTVFEFRTDDATFPRTPEMPGPYLRITNGFMSLSSGQTLTALSGKYFEDFQVPFASNPVIVYPDAELRLGEPE